MLRFFRRKPLPEPVASTHTVLAPGDEHDAMCGAHGEDLLDRQVSVPSLVATAVARARSAPAYACLPPDLDDLQLVPVTEKPAVRANPATYFTDELTEARYRFETSGTSSAPLPIYRTAAEQASNVAAVREALTSLFRGEPLRVVSLLNHNKKAVGALIEELFADHLLFRGFFFEPSGPQPEATGIVMRELGATVIVGTPGVVNELELALRAEGTFAATTGTVKKVLLLGEPVTRAGRARIARAWGAEALELSYGSSETTTIAVGCSHGHLHVLEGRFKLEVRSGDEVSPAVPGSTGELIATPLHLGALALLRYATGDRVTFGPAGECACGSRAMTLQIWGARTTSSCCRTGAASARRRSSTSPTSSRAPWTTRSSSTGPAS